MKIAIIIILLIIIAICAMVIYVQKLLLKTKNEDYMKWRAERAEKYYKRSTPKKAKNDQ